jgi:hypothetical protein
MKQSDTPPSSQVHPDSALPSRPTQPRWIPDAECKQRRCARQTTGCWDKCGLDEVLGLQSQNCVVATVTVSPGQLTQPGDFKNFHRLLCERFGYVHDERDWRRDQLSLIEHIASQIAPTWTPASSPPDADTTVMLALADGEVWQGYWDGSLWIEVSGLHLAPGRVKFWMHTPAHPEDKQ